MDSFCCHRRSVDSMGNEELIETDQKSPKSPPVQHQLDENKNDKKHITAQKTTRFSFDKTEILSASPKRSPAIRHRSEKRQPSWLTRKSADWGVNKSSPASGSRRKEVMIVLMGSSRVGKSSIVNQFLHSIFIHEYCATVDELHWIEYDATNDSADHVTDHVTTSGTLLLKIMDASGSHEFIGMRKLYEQQGDAFIVVVGIDDPSSFEEAKIIRQEISERNAKNAPVICVLNKIDLQKRQKTPVNPIEVRDFAMANHCLFVEVTATEHESVVEIFRRLFQQNSIVPSAAQLKYRRKSVPITNATGEYLDDHTAKKGLGRQKELYKKKYDPDDDHDDEKKSGCIIC